MRDYTQNRYQYNWHWFWDTGNGDIGNQGIHEMDIARWGLGRELPKGAVSTGGKYVYDDDQETPNTQIATFDYGDAELVFEVRGLNTGGEPGIQASGPNFVGVTFFGSDGFMPVDEHGFQIFLGDKREPGEAMKPREHEIDDTDPAHGELPEGGQEPERGGSDGRCAGGGDVRRTWCTWPISVTGWGGSCSSMRRRGASRATRRRMRCAAGRRTGCRTWCRPADRETKSHQQKSLRLIGGFLLLDRATSYSPTHSRVQYNRG